MFPVFTFLNDIFMLANFIHFWEKVFKKYKSIQKKQNKQNKQIKHKQTETRINQKIQDNIIYSTHLSTLVDIV